MVVVFLFPLKLSASEASDLVWSIRTESEGRLEHWDEGRVVRKPRSDSRMRFVFIKRV